MTIGFETFLNKEPMKLYVGVNNFKVQTYHYCFVIRYALYPIFYSFTLIIYFCFFGTIG